MKTMTLATGALTALLSLSVYAGTPHKAGTYAIDAAHSKVGFEIPHLVISTVDGTFTSFEGSVTLAEKFEKSSVKASVEVKSVDTGNGKRDEHLRSPDFFDVAKFPKMTFESTALKGTPEAFKMDGKLTIHGVTKAVTFDGKYLGYVGNDGFGNEKVAFTATAQIKRADFGLTWSKAIEAGPVVGETLTILLKVEAGHPVKK